MNPLSPEMHEEHGNANSLLLIIAWFAIAFFVYWISDVLRLSHKTSVRIWAFCNFAPLVWLATLPNATIPIIVGVGVMMLFSFLMGKAGLETRKKDRE